MIRADVDINVIKYLQSLALGHLCIIFLYYIIFSVESVTQPPHLVIVLYKAFAKKAKKISKKVF